MGTIENIIIDAVKESLDDGLIEQTIRKEVKKSVEESINDVFKWHSNETRKAIEAKINEALVPAIEKWDFSQFIPKLDTVLTEICTQTALMDNKKILDNFRDLMIEPEGDTIELSRIFKEYKKFVAANISTYGREVNTEEKPHYEDVNVKIEVEKDEQRRYSYKDSYTLHFSIEDEDEEDMEALNRDIEVWRYKNSHIEGYEMVYGVAPEIKGLRYLDKFEVFLLRLVRAGIRVLIDIEEDEDWVTPDEEPEASFS